MIHSKGDPGGNWKGNGFVLVTTVVVVEILTTDGINFSARSANEAGTGLELTFKEKLNDKNIIYSNLLEFDILSIGTT